MTYEEQLRLEEQIIEAMNRELPNWERYTHQNGIVGHGLGKSEEIYIFQVYYNESAKLEEIDFPESMILTLQDGQRMHLPVQFEKIGPFSVS